MPDFLQGTLQRYLDQLASGEPTPGGGSAAALSGAMSAALLGMSARFTVGKPKYADFADAAQRVIDEAEPLRAKLERLIEADAAAYGRYRAASAMPKETEDEKALRQAALQEATRDAAQVPLAIAQHSVRLLQLAETLAANCNPFLVSDVVVATHFAQAAFRSALVNVRMNLATLQDADFVADMEVELDRMIAQAGPLATNALKTGYQVMHLPIEGDLPA